MEVRHPPRGVPVTVCVWGVSIMVWGGKHPPKGGCKKITEGEPTEAQIRQVILVAYWLNIGTILVIGPMKSDISPILGQYCQYWPMFQSNIGPISSPILVQHWVEILEQYPVLLGRKPWLAAISHYKPSIVTSHGLSRLASHRYCKPAV